MRTPSLFELITGYMDEAGRHYESDADCGLVVAQIGGEHGNWHTYVQITEDDEVRRVVIHAQLPARIPAGTRLKVAELLTRINYELIVGNFELGLEDGDVLFKTALDLADGHLTKAMFERMYLLNCQVMNQHYGRIWSVAFGEAVAPGMDVATHRLDGTFLQ
ncbi:YbjN domain-containing protein [Polaromonas sp.]|uniref:YbjN domain-containing protein n=1 Tax=Polaromonas sp. TaxID=1869339 RepID=UPI003BAD6721